MTIAKNGDIHFAHKKEVKRQMALAHLSKNKGKAKRKLKKLFKNQVFHDRILITT